MSDAVPDASVRLHRFAISRADSMLVRVDDLDVDSGLLHLRGANGTGKTTLLRGLAGELATDGEARIGGGAPGSLLARAASVFVPTDLYLPEDLRVQEYLSFMARGWRVPDAPLLRLASAFGLDQYLQAWPQVLSRGTRQKVALAAALGLRRPVTLLDEPFGTLDTASRTVLLRELALLVGEGRTAIVTTHGPELDALDPLTLWLSREGEQELDPGEDVLEREA